MRNRVKSILTASLLLFGSVPSLPANAGVIGNGNFSGATGDANQPFVDWSTDSPYRAPLVGGTSPNPKAEFRVGGRGAVFLDEVLLFQNFHLPTDAMTLSFDYLLTPVADATSGGLPDSFQAVLFDSNNVTLLPKLPGTLDAAFQVDNASSPGGGSPESFDPKFVSVASLAGGWRRVNLDVSSLAPQPLRLEFYLAGDDDGFETTVLVDNVTLSRSVVPEPATLGLWIAALALGIPCLAHRRRRSGRLPRSG